MELGAETADAMRFRMLFQPPDWGDGWKPDAAAMLG